MRAAVPATLPAARRASRRVGLLAGLAVGLLGAAAAAPAQVTLQGSPGAPAKGGMALDDDAGTELPPAAKALLAEINRRRAEGASCGSVRKEPAPPMRWNTRLERAAQAHVRDMARNVVGNGASIGHTGSNGSNVGGRVEATGYRWSSVGENVAAGRPDAVATLAQWMASPGHCSNIMNPSFADVAVAGLHWPGTTFNHYWVMVLARP